MKEPISVYWKIRLEKVAEALEKNNFQVYIAESGEAAKALLLDTLIPEAGPRVLSWGGSMTLFDTGILKAVAQMDHIEIINPSAKGLSKEEQYQKRREALLSDLFLTGTNAVTEKGHLVNLDMIGNRIAGLTFGPREVVVMVGRNKIVPDLESAMRRIKDFAAPVNTMRLDKKTPCRKTAACQDCSSPDRICNTWTITEKSFPPKRVKVVLIHEDLGY